MKNKKVLLLCLGFVVLIGGAALLYNVLAARGTVDQLSTQQPPAASGEGAASSAAEEQPRMDAPEFTAYDADDNPVRLSDYFGKPIVLNFWASWCSPCKSEMPEFDEKYREIGEDVQFLMVNVTTSARESYENASSFIAEQGFAFPVLYDKDGVGSVVYNTYSLPVTYFIDADGKLVAQATGAINGELLQKGIDMITE